MVCGSRDFKPPSRQGRQRDGWLVRSQKLKLLAWRAWRLGGSVSSPFNLSPTSISELRWAALSAHSQSLCDGPLGAGGRVHQRHAEGEQLVAQGVPEREVFVATG